MNTICALGIVLGLALGTAVVSPATRAADLTPPADTTQTADIVIGVPSWPSARATAHVLKVALEDHAGLTVALRDGTNAAIFEAMDQGTMHVHPEVWLPNQRGLHDLYVKDKGTVAMNPNGVPAFQGMCIPKYIRDEHYILRIEDLTDPGKAAIFDTDGDGRGELWIGAPGWASTNIEKVRARSYGYAATMELTQSDEKVAYASLDAAINAGKPWVGYCYAPHYVFVLHQLQVLEEPAHDPTRWKVLQPRDAPDWLERSSAPVAWDTAQLHVHYASALEKDHPEAARLLANVKLDTDTLSAMTYALVIDTWDPVEYARQWVQENQARVQSWLGN